MGVGEGGGDGGGDGGGKGEREGEGAKEAEVGTQSPNKPEPRSLSLYGQLSAFSAPLTPSEVSNPENFPKFHETCSADISTPTTRDSKPRDEGSQDLVLDTSAVVAGQQTARQGFSGSGSRHIRCRCGTANRSTRGIELWLSTDPKSLRDSKPLDVSSRDLALDKSAVVAGQPTARRYTTAARPCESWTRKTTRPGKRWTRSRTRPC